MQMHHALRLRLLVQRLSAPSILSPENCGVVMHSLRLLGALRVRDASLLHRVDAAVPLADLRSRANIFHCLCCCTREQETPQESLPAPLAPLLLRLQESLLPDVDDLAATECVLVMEASVRLTAFGAAHEGLAATLRHRAAALAAVVERPVELVGVARIVAEALQMPNGADEWAQEMREVARAIDARLDDFGRQDLFALLEAITLRTPHRVVHDECGADADPEADRMCAIDTGRTMGRPSPGQSERRVLSSPSSSSLSSSSSSHYVPDECRALLGHILTRVEALAARLSPSQTAAWLSRVAALQGDDCRGGLFDRLVARLEEPAGPVAAMTPAQLSTCLAAVATQWQRSVGSVGEMGPALERRCRDVCAVLLAALLPALRDADAVLAHFYPLLPLLPPVVRALAPREAADCLARLLSATRAMRPRDIAAAAAFAFASGALRGQDALLREWCNAVKARAGDFNARDALQVLNEAAAALYADAEAELHTSADTGGYNAAVVRPLLERLHEVASAAKDLNAASTAQLARYLSSISKIGVRRKTDYYHVLRLLETRELTAFEQLRILGVVARHHLRAERIIMSAVANIPSRVPELHARQKCLLLKYLGQARAQRFVKAPLHRSLTPVGFFSSEAAIAELEPRDAIFALVGLVELRQFRNPTVPLLLSGPLAAPQVVDSVRSAAVIGEFAAALSRLDCGAVPEETLCAALHAAARRLPASRSFFVDAAAVAFWIRLVRLRHEIERAPGPAEITARHAAALAAFQSVAAGMAEARLLDIARAANLRPNTFLFHQMAIGCRLDVALPPEDKARLVRHLDTRRLPQLLSDPRQIVDAVTTALYIAPQHAETAAEVLRFAAKHFGSLGIQEVLLLGADIADMRKGSTPYGTAEVQGAAEELYELVRLNATDPQRRQRLSLQEIAFGVHYGILDATK